MDWKSIIIFVIIVGGIGLTSSLFHFFRNKRKEIALSLFSAVFALFVAEYITRFFYPQLTEHDDMFEFDLDLGWKFVPSKKGWIIYPGEVSHYIETNSRGFRDNPPLPKQDKSQNILVLGDSFVSNIAVESDEVFTEVLQERLKNTEVLNFGVNGYGPVQEYLLLQEWYTKINPDIIILMVYIQNDFADNIGRDWLYPRPFASWDEKNQEFKINPTPQLKDTSELTIESMLRIYRKSHLYHLFRKRINFLRTKFSQENQPELIPSVYTPAEFYLCRSQPSENTELMYQTMEQILLRFAQFSDEQEIPLVFAIAPSIVQVEDELWSSFTLNYDGESGKYIRTLPNDRLIQFAKNNNLQMIDLLPTLQSEAKKGKILYNPKEQHWTSEGNRIVARSLNDYLKTKSLIE